MGVAPSNRRGENHKMLPPTAKTYFDTLWEERSGEAWRDLAEKERAFDRSEVGQCGSHGYAARLAALLQESLTTRSTWLLATLLEVHADFGAPVDDGIEDELIDWGARSLATQMQGLEAHFVRKLGSFGVGPWFCTNLDQTAPLCDLQIRNGVRRHLWKMRNVPMKRPGTQVQQTSGPTIKVVGNVGGIFTGEKASATIHQHVHSGQELALAKALEALALAIASEKGLAVAEQTALVDDARAAAAELTTQRPSQGRISGLLAGLNSSVGTLAAIKPAMEAVLDLAAAIGIRVP